MTTRFNLAPTATFIDLMGEIDEYTTPPHPDPDIFVWQAAITDRLGDVPEPARSWMRHWAGIEEEE